MVHGGDYGSGCGGDDEGGEGGGVRGGGGAQDAGQLRQLHPALQAGVQYPGVEKSPKLWSCWFLPASPRLMMITLMEKPNKVDRNCFYSSNWHFYQLRNSI